MFKKTKSHHLNRQKIRRSFIAAEICLIFFVTVFGSGIASAVTNPQSGSIGLEGTVGGTPPQKSPTVSVPGNHQSFTTQTITVAGICQDGLLVKVFDNNVFVGSTTCKSGSFSLQISLFSGANSIVATQYDGLDQASPSSITINVTYNNTASPAFSGPLLSLTSSYAQRGVNPGQQLSWPIIISGGTEPYALSVDWGDSTKPQLLSEPFSGTINLSHTYTSSGTYQVTIQATDKNGETAFLQVVAIVNGPAVSQGSSSASSSGGTTKTITKVVWWPLVLFLPLLPLAFWLGGRQALLSLQKKMEKSSEENL